MKCFLTGLTMHTHTTALSLFRFYLDVHVSPVFFTTSIPHNFTLFFPFCLNVLSYTPRRIYQAGFPICHDFNQFVERFLILLQGVHLCEITEYREVSYQICTEVLHKRTGWQMGYTKVFLKVGLLYKLIFRALNKNTVVPGESVFGGRESQSNDRVCSYHSKVGAGGTFNARGSTK